jgi:CheY-like chemotaxis protein
MWVLIIDDDEEDVEFFTEVLKEAVEDCQCVAATTCEKGLLTLADKKDLPSHIFMDGMLYGMSSKDCLAKFKDDARVKNIKVIMYSGFSVPSVQQDFLSLGADLFLLKPANKQELIEALQRILIIP